MTYYFVYHRVQKQLINFQLKSFIGFIMKTDIKTKIYSAQCIGNVEPIEYMTPYPSMRSLIEGQTIKFSDQMMNEISNITNQDFFDLVMQTSNWLQSIGIEPKQRVIVPELEYLECQILLFGIWNMGCSAVFTQGQSIENIDKRIVDAQTVRLNESLFDTIKTYSNKYLAKHKPLLSDEAILSFEKESGIRLSHYNLLINVNGIQKAIGLKSRTSFHCDLRTGSICWIIFQAILPVHCGLIYNNKNPELTIGESGKDYNLRHDLNNLSSFSSNDIAICIENTAALSINGEPIHLSDYDMLNDGIRVRGHSVMMGYLDDEINEVAFENSGLKVSF